MMGCTCLSWTTNRQTVLLSNAMISVGRARALGRDPEAASKLPEGGDVEMGGALSDAAVSVMHDHAQPGEVDHGGTGVQSYPADDGINVCWRGAVGRVVVLDVSPLVRRWVHRELARTTTESTGTRLVAMSIAFASTLSRRTMRMDLLGLLVVVHASHHPISTSRPRHIVPLRKV